MKNKKSVYTLVSLIILLIGIGLGSLITNKLSFNPFKFVNNIEIINVRTMSIDDGFINIHSGYNDCIYIVDIVNEVGEVAKISAFAHEVTSYFRNGRVNKRETDRAVFGFSSDIEGQCLTQTAIPPGGQINVFFDLKKNSFLTIRYYIKTGNSSTRLITKKFELQDDGFYIEKMSK